MTFMRRIGAVALAALLAMGVPVFAAAPAQAAAPSVITPANGAVITSGSELSATARFELALTMQLWVEGPGIGNKFLQERVLTGKLSGTFPIGRNGEYTVYLRGKQTGRIYDSNTIKVRIAPAVPSGVSARVSGRELVVGWKRGSEDDLTGYTLSGSGVASKSGSVGSFCQETSCSTKLSVTRSSGLVSVGVRARRSAGKGGSLYSGTATASATVSGGSRLQGGDSSSAGSGRLPGVDTPLAPLNDQSPVTLPSARPDGAAPGVAYPAPQVANGATEAQHVAATDRLRWAKNIGIALILLIVAAHLGMWTRGSRVAQARVSRSGTAARMARSGTGRERVRQAQREIARAEALAKAAPAELGDAAKERGENLNGSRSGDTVAHTLSFKDVKAVGSAASAGERSAGVVVRVAGSTSASGEEAR
ncbi:hypothetical protein [Actinomadura spongiicola]|uniref:hypothetical protein n=1 Tax=Actinomadura spongiicola TaxID=2303421 RepID=UPI0011C0E4B4|nr:hypothetical protein [Actinomadura spongiicola]